MSLWKMVVDFEELREITGEVNQISEHVSYMAEEHGMRAICGIKEAWEGRCADDFERKLGKYIERLREVAADLLGTAKRLEEMVQQIDATEKGNVTTAWIRTY